MRATIVVFIALLAACGGSPERAPEEYLAAVEAVGEPPFDPARKQEPGYFDAYRRAQHELYREKAVIMLDLLRAHRDDPRVGEWADRRWELLAWNQEPEWVAEEVLDDVAKVTALLDSPAVSAAADFWRARYLLVRHGNDPEVRWQVAEDFARAHPEDERGTMLLHEVGSDPATPPDLARRAWRSLREVYPDSHWGRYAAGLERRLDAVGEPFELAFVDLVGGREVTIDDLRGKVVLIDFWSTTCAPCVAELPDLIELYERNRERGLEVIGVSLDEAPENGGREALLAFVEEHGVPWPQYYQGNGFDSHFSTGWGVGSIPAAFLVDRRGRLRTTEARGRFEELIPALLAEGAAG